jgi:hypothetical protein
MEMQTSGLRKSRKIKLGWGLHDPQGHCCPVRQRLEGVFLVRSLIPRKPI